MNVIVYKCLYIDGTVTTVPDFPLLSSEGVLAGVSGSVW